MKSISVLVTHNALTAALANTRNMFTMVNNFLRESGKEALFEVTFIGLEKEIKLDGGIFTVQVDKELSEVENTDLIIIPPLCGNMQKSIDLNVEFLPWIKKHYKGGAEIACLCMGSFLLAETGLLDGKDCSLNWKFVTEFKKRYPGVNLVDEKIITDYSGIYTNGGANSYWTLLIYLIERYVDRELAIRTSRYFEVEMGEINKFSFLIFNGNKLHDDELVIKSQHYIEEKYKEKITIEKLAQISNLSRRSFQRRFKKATHLNVAEYVKKVKVEAAKNYLESGKLTINEIMFEVGYNDPKTFRKTFKKMAGVTPIHYRQRYS